MSSNASTYTLEESAYYRQFRKRRESGMFKIAILMMQKNERVMLPIWFKYYERLFGADSLYVYDNGSSVAGVGDILAEISAKGSSVIVANGKSCFENKGSILLEKAYTLFERGYNLVYFADCDEFLVCNDDSGPLMSRDDIYRELNFCLEGECSILRVGVGWLNVVGTNRFYSDIYGHKKIILRRDVSREVRLDTGFHLFDWGRRVDNTSFGSIGSTRLGYLHFHNRPYEEFCVMALEKLSGRVNVNNPAELEAYNGPGMHLVRPLLDGEETYYRNLMEKNRQAVAIKGNLLERFENPYAVRIGQ